jgi:uncharacterized protein
LDTIFLDANVLYSAAYMQFAGLARLWSLKDVQLLSSAYAIDEARRNLTADRPEAVQLLNRLLESVSTVDAPQGLELPENVRLDPKDRPILLAAILAGGDSRQGQLSTDRRRETFPASLWKADRGRPGAEACAVF